MFCPVLKKPCLEDKCKIWDICTWRYSSESEQNSQSYIENHTVKEIAIDFLEYLKKILDGERITNRDFYVEECFWNDKLGDAILPHNLEFKRLESMQLAEKMYAEILFGEFYRASIGDIAQKIVNWAKKNNYTTLDEEKIDLFWKEGFHVDLYQLPASEFDKRLQQKFIQASILASSLMISNAAVQK